jgi:hypothetical protein
VADSVLNDLSSVTSPADADILYIVTDPSGSPTDGKIAVSDLRGPGGSGSETWTKIVDVAGANLTGWSTVTSGWDSNGSAIQMTEGTGGEKGLWRTEAPFESDGAILSQVEVFVPTAGGDVYAGLTSHSRAGVIENVFNFLVINDGAWWTQLAAGGNVLAKTLADVTFDTWHTLRLLITGSGSVGWLDGSFVAMGGGFSPHEIAGIGLYNYNTIANYRNFKLWTLDRGLPA